MARVGKGGGRAVSRSGGAHRAGSSSSGSGGSSCLGTILTAVQAFATGKKADKI